MKTGKIILIALAALAVGAVIASLALFGVGVQNAESYTAYDTTADPAVTEIRVNIATCAVQLIRTEGEQITVRYYDNEHEYFTVGTEGGILDITRRPTPWYRCITFGDDGIAYELEIGVPAGFTGKLSLKASSGLIEVDRVSCASAGIDASSGEIRLTSLTSAGELSVNISSGGLSMQSVSAASLSVIGHSGSLDFSGLTVPGSVNITCSSGNIDGRGVTCGSFSSDVKSGGISIADITAGSVRASASSGHLEFTGLNATDTALTVSSGSIKAYLIDAVTNYRVTSNVSSGSSNISTGNYGTEKTLSVSASSGSIRVYFAGN